MANDGQTPPMRVRRAPGAKIEDEKPEAKPQPADEKPEAKPPIAKSEPAAKDKLEADGGGDPSLATPAPSALGATAPPAAAGPAIRRYKVWEHGTLQRDGRTYAPGAELTLPEDVAAKIPCLIPA